MKANCVVCGAGNPRPYPAKTCSEECGAQLRRVYREQYQKQHHVPSSGVEKTCVVCCQKFVTRTRTTACSPECRRAHRLSRWNKWSKLNKQRIAAKDAKWRLANPDRVKSRAAVWDAMNPEKRRLSYTKIKAEQRAAKALGITRVEYVIMKIAGLYSEATP